MNLMQLRFIDYKIRTGYLDKYTKGRRNKTGCMEQKTELSWYDGTWPYYST